MPSASAKIEKVVSSEAFDPLKCIFNALEKKMRNLDKRKMKLDNYKMDVSNGKELNEDQKIAVSKYDQVEVLLEFSREMVKSMTSIVLECTRQQKKLAKKEQLERQQHEIQKLQEAFIYRHILSCFENDDARSDFLNGENGAVKITNDQLSQLNQLYKLIDPALPNVQADISNHFHVLAENVMFLVEGRNKEIAGTTYKVFKELLHSIKESGYFSRPSEPIEEEVTSSDDTPEDVVVEKTEPCNDIEIIENEILLSDDQPEIESVEEVETPTASAPALIEATLAVSSMNLQNGPLQEVLASQGSFNFLQESQIDLDAPHMDPAVVSVHQIAPPPTVNFPISSYPASPTVVEMTKSVVNGTDRCDISVLPPVTPQLPIMAAGIPRTIAPVLTAVQHSSPQDFDPSHPIPTQTFTNQSFAVMQNMIMPQAYVPVTMHHGPIPPHMTPIAVVPGLSPSVSSAAPVMPVHVPVPPVIASPTIAVPNADISENIAPKPAEIEDSQQNTTEKESASASEPITNGVVNEKNGNHNDGFAPTFRGGFRGRGRGRSNNGFFRGRPNYHNGRGGYQNHYYSDRNGYGNFRRGNNRDGPRGNGNNRGRGSNNYRTMPSQQQQQQQQQQPEQQTQH